LEGEYVEYHPNGLIKVQGYYEQGKKVGVWRYYDKKGTLLREETWSLDAAE
jgi:antitoxin component YwqK of YwqJK toxin-antitoxin module